jgi:hypothetical protein
MSMDTAEFARCGGRLAEHSRAQAGSDVDGPKRPEALLRLADGVAADAAPVDELRLGGKPIAGPVLTAGDLREQVVRDRLAQALGHQRLRAARNRMFTSGLDIVAPTVV